MRVSALLLALAAAACTYQPPVQPGIPVDRAAPVWRAVSTNTGAVSGEAELAELALAYPDSASVHLRLLQAYFGAENAAGTVREALWLAVRGYSFSEDARGRILDLAGETATADRLSRLLAQNAVRIEKSVATASVPDDVLLVEGVAVDPLTGGLIVSSVVSRTLASQSAPGVWNTVSPSDAGNLSGMVFDVPRGMFWVASGDLGMMPQGDEPFRGIYGFRQGEPDNPIQIAAPDGVNLSDVTVAADGTVYASDPVGGGIYMLAGGRISEFVAPGTFRSPQGLAISVDGRRIFVSDYRYGIAIVDLQTGSVSRLGSARPMILDGIDGIWRVGNSLIAIQNGMMPMRIVEISLSPNGNYATALKVLEQNHSEWSEPLGGSIYGGALYYVSTGQWDKFQAGGTLKDGLSPIPTQVRRLPL
ncbi:hypothetical protein [Pontixanthobacter luteolus]|uniref:hypothetical protein n=1 Tax=Pontixanthobacter luteolus TaxID=295089 RepID=UPI002304CC9E|nr:hypothetical protein [Pontixanthobacter luteolus]